MNKYDFVTVAHEIDYALMRLQARSINKYVPRDLVDRIIVVENFTPGVDPHWRDTLLADYGYLADRVVFHRSYDLAPMKGSGWWTQQVLKLEIAKYIDVDRYVVLDAKNHFTHCLDRSFLETEQGKARVRKYGYATHPLRDALERSLDYLAIKPDPYIDKFFPTSTPFTIFREVALQLMAYVEETEGASFQDVFLNKRLTEFFLYSGWLYKTDVADLLYEDGQPDIPVIWDYDAKNDPEMTLLKAISRAESHQRPLFAVHRNAMVALDETGREILAQFWVRRGLFANTDEANAFIKTVRK